ncbi:argininosuccinate synthase [Streptomyces sp. HUAS TT20]|nr:argininosuccinate synthase [Streptomyces sp. HUAS 15-9]UXY28700.1 argininosuccinate synthase [Streptomyces sp. HUAS 15-9]
MYTWSRPTAAPGETETLTVAFEHGLPVTVDGVPLELTELIDQLNR